jgi:hypothetical protein
MRKTALTLALGLAMLPLGFAQTSGNDSSNTDQSTTKRKAKKQKNKKHKNGASDRTEDTNGRLRDHGTNTSPNTPSSGNPTNPSNPNPNVPPSTPPQ